MRIRCLPAQARAPRPWRNGGGVTSDVATFPDGASDEEFLWRASIATIDDYGPFSSWPGIDRTLIVLRGRLALTMEAEREQQLEEGSSAFTFAGEMRVVAKSVSEACLAFNLMVRRGWGQLRIQRGSNVITTDADQTLLLATQATTIHVNRERFELGRADAVMLEPDCATILETDRSPIVVEFFCKKRLIRS